MIYCGIIDPFISSQYLAETMRAQKIQLLALLTNPEQAIDLQSHHRFQPEQFAQIISIAHLSDKQIDEQLKVFKPRIIMAGWEFISPLTDRIATRLTPKFANPPHSSSLRCNKAAMQEVISQAGIPAARSESVTSTSQLKQVLQNWQWPIVVKPTETAGTFGVKICHNFQEIEQHTQQLLHMKYNYAHEPVHAVLLQEFLEGDEYYIDSCSHQGQHRLASLGYYKKELRNGLPIYRYAELKDFTSQEGQILSAYLKRVLTAVELHNGLAHTEIMLTKKGPRLIEVNPRISGAYGLLNSLANKVYHSDQVILLAKSIKNPTAFLAHANTIPTFYCHGRLIFLHCFENRKIRDFNYALVSKLESYKGHFLLKSPGTLVSGEANLADTVMFVELLHNDHQIIKRDTEQLFDSEQRGELF